MRVREYVLLGVAAVVAVVCVRLGFWQLGRLDERRAWNRSVAQRMDNAPVTLADVPADTGAARYRRVMVRGVYDYEREIVLTSRSRNGSPGVNILTPLRVPGNDTAVLVNRGWIYAPDGMNAPDMARWREGDSVSVTGIVVPFVPRTDIAARSQSRANAFRWLQQDTLRAVLSYPVRPYTIIVQGDTGRGPPRLAPPVLDEGSHKSYAFQWFAFASVAVVGGVLFGLRTRKS